MTQLEVRRDITRWSPASITDFDMHLVAGEFGGIPQAKAAQEKLDAWPKIHDTKAPLVRGR
jgi:hypothetical protein